MKTPADLGFPLELSATDYRDLIEAVLPRLQNFIEHVDKPPVDRAKEMTASALTDLIEPLPQHGQSLDQVLTTLFDTALPHSLNPTSPGFMGYVPGGGLLYAAVADLIANTLNRYVGAAPVAPGFSQLESNVVRWFCEMLALPAGSGGFLTSGGSLANLSALATARIDRLGEDFDDGVIYLSDQAHSCLEKAAKLCGIKAANVRLVDTDPHYRLCVRSLEHAIAEDRKRGLQPFFVGVSAGTTNTGAIDPLEAIAAVCHRENLWLHVDAAYGGFFNLTERGRKKLRGIEKADSIALDPHKTLFLPYGTGALIVRDQAALGTAHTVHADYLPGQIEQGEVMDFRNLSPELTRPFRALRVWLPLKLHGTDVFAAYLDEKLDLATWINDKLAAIPQLDVLAEPELSILAFAIADSPGQSLEARNARSRRLLELINEQNRTHLTATMLHGIFALRVAIVVFRTHRSHLEQLLEDIVAALDALDI